MKVMPPPTAPEKPSLRYWAFISYSSKDRAFARWLHGALESYCLPAQLINHPTPCGERVPRRLRPLYWDRAEMSAHHDLGVLIHDSLSASRHLIVVCSPSAANSAWVEKEIQAFRQMHGPERILAVILDGEPGAGDGRNCFPPALRGQEPKAPDARPQGDGRNNAKLMLVAAMLGVDFDQLKRRHVLRQRWRIAQAAVLAAALLLGIGWWWRAEQKVKKDIVRQGEIQQQVEAGRQKLMEGDPGAALAWLSAAFQNGGRDVVTRHLLASAIDALEPPDYSVVNPAGGRITKACFVGSSDYLLTTGAEDETQVRKVEDGSVVAAMRMAGTVVPGLPDVRPVSRIAFSFEGGEVLCQNILTGELVSRLKGHSALVTTAAASPSEQRVVTGSADKTAKVWRIQGPELLTTTPAQETAVTSVRMSPDESWFVTGAADGGVRVWDARTGVLIRDLGGQGSGVTHIRLSSDGRAMAVETMKGAAAAWATEDWSLIGRLSVSPARVRRVFFGHPEAPVAALVVNEAGHDIKVVGLMDGRTIREFKGHSGDIGHVCLSDAGDVMASQSMDGTVRVWDVVGGRCTHVFGSADGFSPMKALGQQMDLAPDGSRVLRLNAEGELRVWQTSRATALPGQEPGNGAQFAASDALGDILLGWNSSQAWIWKAEPPRLLQAWKAPSDVAITNAMLAGDGGTAVLVTADGGLRAMDVRSGAVSEPRPYSWGFDFLPDGKGCAVGADGEVVLLDLAGWRERRRVSLPAEPSGERSPGLSRRLLRVHPGGEVLAIAAGGGTMHFLAISSGSLMRTFQTKSGEGVQDLRWSSNGGHLLVSTARQAEVWTQDGLHRHTGAMVHDPRMMSAAFSPSGRRFATLGGDGLVHVYETASGALHSSMKAGATFVNMASFSQDEELLMTSSNEGPVTTWSVRSGRPVGTLPGNLGFFPPSGRHMLTSGPTVLILPLRFEELDSQELAEVSLRLSGWSVQGGGLIPARTTPPLQAGETPPRKKQAP